MGAVKASTASWFGRLATLRAHVITRMLRIYACAGASM